MISIHSIHSLLLTATPEDIPQSYRDLLIKAYYTYYVPVLIDMLTNNNALYEEAYRLISEQYALFASAKHKNHTKEYLRDVSFMFAEETRVKNEKERFKRLILLFLYLNELIHQFNASKQLFVWKKNVNEDDSDVLHEREYQVNAMVSLVDDTAQMYHVFAVNVDDAHDYVMLIINDFILMCENSRKGHDSTMVRIVYKFLLRDVKVKLCDSLLPHKGNVFMLFNGKESKGSYYTMEIRYTKDTKDNDVVCETIHSVIAERRKNVIELEKQYVREYFDSLLLEYTKSKC